MLRIETGAGSTFVRAALGGFLLVAPLAALEAWNNREALASSPQFPFPLFGVLWLLSMVFMGAGVSLTRARPLGLFFRIVIMTVAAVAWGLVVYDQFPCFLGVPNCD
jgi:hypothetical protein